MYCRLGARRIETGVVLNCVVAIAAALLLAGCAADDGDVEVSRVETMQIPVHQATTPVIRLQKQCVKMHEDINKLASKGGIDLVFIGDSIVEFWGNRGKQVWAKYYAPRRGANFGINGDCTEHIAWRVDNGNFDNISPKLVIVLAGTNNTRFNTAEQISDGVTLIVQKLRKKVPNAKILVMAIFPQGKRLDDYRRVKSVSANKTLKGIADGRMVHYIDIGHVFLKKDGTIDPKLLDDYVHPTPEGYRLWAEAIEPKVAELMGE